MASKLKINIVFYTKEEIKKELSEIEKNLITNPVQAHIGAAIRSKIKEVKIYLSRASLPGSLSEVFLQRASGDLFILKKMIAVEDLDYQTICLNTSADKQIETFMNNKHRFSDEEYWRYLAEAYVIQNYKKIPYKTLYLLFSADRPKRNKLMSKEELKFLKGLPSRITIYRGGSLSESKSKKYGISWTLDKKIAQSFAEVKSLRDRKEMKVHELTINKSAVIAYFNTSEEQEIIYIHELVTKS